MRLRTQTKKLQIFQQPFAQDKIEIVTWTLVIGQVATAFLLFFASRLGNPILYAGFGLAFVGLVMIPIIFRRFTATLSAVFVTFITFRLMPLLKYAQPMFDDSWFDLRTATYFADANKIVPVPVTPTNFTLATYSKWPMIHLLSIVISRTLGVSLYDVYTYFGPIVAFPSVLFIYLLGREIFDEPWKAAMAALVLSSFSIPLFWQMQMVRQNLGITVFTAGLYAYVKARKSMNQKTLIVSLLFFACLPLVHHLTALAALATLSIGFLLERVYWKRPAPIWFLLFVVSITALTWATVQGDFIIPAIFNRPQGLLNPEQGQLSFILTRLQEHSGLFDLLSLIRVMILATIAFYGLYRVVRRKVRYGGLLAGLFVGNLIPLFLALFVSQDVDERFALLITIPTALLVALVIPKKRLLPALLLILIVLPTPFKLYETFNATPTYIYDANSSVNFSYGEFSKFRGADTFILSHWNAEFNGRMPILADLYTGALIQQEYDPTLIYYVGSPNPTRISYHPSANLLVFFHLHYSHGRYGPAVIADLNGLVAPANLIYNDGSQIGYFVG